MIKSEILRPLIIDFLNTCMIDLDMSYQISYSSCNGIIFDFKENHHYHSKWNHAKDVDPFIYKEIVLKIRSIFPGN